MQESAAPSQAPLAQVLAGRCCAIPPVWLMRQAGRYLPEYRAVRARAGSFLNLCFTPELAAEVTLQPVRRFGFDAAILFCDILVVPYALGVNVSYEEAEGPRLDPVIDGQSLGRLPRELDHRRLSAVYETIARLKPQLAPEVALLGFCGAPFTVASYMVAGRGAGEAGSARRFAYQNPEAFGKLIDILVGASVSYLVRQFAAGVDAVQIFDTWAGVLAPREFASWVVEPTRQIVEGVRKAVPGAPIIGFPRGAGSSLSRYLAEVRVNAVGLDWTIDPSFARERTPSHVALQGNLDPMALLAGGAALDRAVDDVIEAFASRPFIFNLGHGILPETPIAHVEQMLARVRGR